MNVENISRRASIYEYFYGKNVVFQIFLIVICILMTSMASRAEMAARSAAYEKKSDLREEYQDLRSDLYEMKADSEAKASDIERLEKKVEKAEEKYEDYQPSEAKGVGPILRIIGIVGAIASLVWLLVKKLSYDVSGESEVDAELAQQTERAKVKGLEKLNIIAEQIEQVEPVCLHGVASSNFTVTKPAEKLRNVSGAGFARYFLLALVCALIFGISMLFKSFVVDLLLFLALSAAVGYYIFDRYEKQRVNAKTIEELKKYPAVFRRRINANGGVRYSLPEITVYMFGKTQLYLYYQQYDLVTGEVFSEGMKEFFYDDICAVSSHQDILRYSHVAGLFAKRKFFRCIREEVTVYSSGCSYNTSYLTPMGQSVLDTKFVGMRNLIRSKKDDYQ